jgi:hypothetical protein
MSTFVNQVGGDHYQKPIQVWDFVVANKIGFLEGNVIKYVERWERKDGLKDLEKAKSYVEKLIAVEKARLASQQPEPESNSPRDQITREVIANGRMWVFWGGTPDGKPTVNDDLRVEVELRDGSVTVNRADKFDWKVRGHKTDIHRYRAAQR